MLHRCAITIAAVILVGTGLVHDALGQSGAGTKTASRVGADADAEPKTVPEPGKLLPPTLVRHGVLVDRQHEHLYVMRPQRAHKRKLGTKLGGGLEARRLKDGKLAWQTKRAARPLGMAGKYLIAQAEPSPKKKAKHLRLVVLTRAKGKVHCDLKPTIPELLHTGIDGSMQTGLGAHLVEWKGKTYVWWASSFNRVSGMRRPPRPDDHKSTSGLVRIDPESCKATPLDSPKLPGARTLNESSCQIEDLEMATATHMSRGRVVKIAGLRTLDNGSRRGAWAAFWVDGCKELASSDDADIWRFRTLGPYVVALKRSQADGKIHYALERWSAETGKQVDPVDLVTVAEPGQILFSTDGHLALGEVVRKDKATKLHWHIVSADGEKVVEITSQSLGSTFVVAGERVVTGGASVFDANSGELLFTRPVRQTRYSGPLPP